MLIMIIMIMIIKAIRMAIMIIMEEEFRKIKVFIGVLLKILCRMGINSKMISDSLKAKLQKDLIAIMIIGIRLRLNSLLEMKTIMSNLRISQICNRRKY